jgi:hypothetical protein
MQQGPEFFCARNGAGKTLLPTARGGNPGDLFAYHVGVNVLFWRPLVAYAEKFRVETSEAAEQPKSYVLNFLRRSSVPRYIAGPLRASPWSRSSRAFRPSCCSRPPFGASRERRGSVPLLRAERLRRHRGARLPCRRNF